MPEPKYPDMEKLSRWLSPPEIFKDLRYRIFIIYRRLFSLVWLTNLDALLVILLIPTIDRTWLATIAVLNLTVAIVIRQDFVINLIFAICCLVPRSWPLEIRRKWLRRITSVGSIPAVPRLLYAGSLDPLHIVSRPALPFTHCYSRHTQTIHRNAFFVKRCIDSTTWHGRVCLSGTSKALSQLVRTHSSVLRLVRSDPGVDSVNVFCSRYETPQHFIRFGCSAIALFWLLLIITMSIATSWIFLKRVPIDANVLSTHAIRLHFDYTDAARGRSIRLSERPLLEWNFFAIILIAMKKETQAKGCSVIVSKAGDWTTRQISKPPTRLWVRGVPTSGVMRVASLFRSVVLIGTGSGIGPLDTFRPVDYGSFGPLRPPPDINQVHDADPRALIHDTRALGRRDLVQIACDAMKEIEAEVMIIISNETVTRIVVREMERRGIPAYGAIWDS